MRVIAVTEEQYNTLIAGLTRGLTIGYIDDAIDPVAYVLDEEGVEYAKSKGHIFTQEQLDLIEELFAFGNPPENQEGEDITLDDVELASILDMPIFLLI